MADGGSVVGVVVTLEVGGGGVDEVTWGAATVIVLAKMDSYFLA